MGVVILIAAGSRSCGAIRLLGGWIQFAGLFSVWLNVSMVFGAAAQYTLERIAMLGQKFDEALALASELHREQNRKGTPTPYMSHLMAVAGIVLEANAYHQMDNIEDVAIGALLHDAIEDQGHKINLEQIKDQFGDTVRRIVFECSDAIVTEIDGEKPPWKERKKAYLGKIANKSQETLLVSCADKLHNARCIMFDYDRIGDKIWDRFNAGKDGTVWYYKSLAEEFERAWPENPLLPDFQALVVRMKRAAS